MDSAVNSAVGIVAYMALFAGVGIVFLFANLFVGRFFRPNNPQPEKLEIYECGEPTIGSSFVQFDLRFYVVALLFIIFDVEVAFFFPWGAVFGKAMHFTDQRLPIVVTEKGQPAKLSVAATGLYHELGVSHPELPAVVPASLADNSVVLKATNDAERSTAIVREGAHQLAWVTAVDIAFFFAVLMIGFAYVWRRGDLDWVRAVSQQRASRDFKSRNLDPLEEESAVAAV
jgi:NADH-quinone oxidoreductase subunit A